MDIAAQVGSYLLVGGAVITALALVLPHPREVDALGYAALTAFMLALAFVIWPRRGAEQWGRSSGRSSSRASR